MEGAAWLEEAAAQIRGGLLHRVARTSRGEPRRAADIDRTADFYIGASGRVVEDLGAADGGGRRGFQAELRPRKAEEGVSTLLAGTKEIGSDSRAMCRSS